MSCLRTTSPYFSNSKNRLETFNKKVLTRIHSSNFVVVQKRSYIFLPSNLYELRQSVSNTLESLIGSKDGRKWIPTRIRLKLRNYYAPDNTDDTGTTTTPPTKARINYEYFQTIIRKKRDEIGTKVRQSSRKRRYRYKRLKERVFLSARYTLEKQKQILIQRAKSFEVQVKSRYYDRIEKGRDGGKTGEHYDYRTITIHEPSSKCWFDDDGYPLTSRDAVTGRYVNPWQSVSSNGKNPPMKLARWFLEKIPAQISFSGDDTLPSPPKKTSPALPPLSPTTVKTKVTAGTKASSSKMKLTWIGHSTTLLRMSSFTILTDPMFSLRASPIQYPPFGASRFPSSSLSFEEQVMQLPPKIDVVMISHDHYDHLDRDSVEVLKNRVQWWCVPRGVKEWMLDNVKGMKDSQERILDMEWWESGTFRLKRDGAGKVELVDRGWALPSKRRTRDEDLINGHGHHNNEFSNELDGPELLVTCAPSQHWCGRSPFDRNRRLWCSWALKTTSRKPQQSQNTHNNSLNFYFGGDTGLPLTFPLHKQIGDLLGPFDLSALPIGSYSPRFFEKDGHINPEEAVKIHQDLRSRRSVGVHWGTFVAGEEKTEPKIWLEDILKDQKNVDFVVLEKGQSIESIADAAWKEDLLMRAP